MLLLFWWLLLYFFKECNEMAVAILQLWYDFSTHRLMYRKSNWFVYKFVVNCQILYQLVPYEAEAWHAWSQEQYFSKHLFLDICQCAFKVSKDKNISRWVDWENLIYVRWNRIKNCTQSQRRWSIEEKELRHWVK